MNARFSALVALLLACGGSPVTEAAETTPEDDLAACAASPGGTDAKSCSRP